jgi:hypothetical protein
MSPTNVSELTNLANLPLTQLNAVEEYSNLVATYGKPYVDSAIQSLNLLTPELITYVVTTLRHVPEFDLNSVMVVANNFPLIELTDFVDEVKSIGLVNYQQQNPTTPFHTLVVDAIVLGVQILDVCISLHNDVIVENLLYQPDPTPTIAVIDIVQTLPQPVIQTVTNNISTHNLHTWLNTILTYGANVVGTCSTPIKNIIGDSVSISDTVVGIVSLMPENIPEKDLQRFYASMVQLSDNQTSTIKTRLALTEVSSMIDTVGVDGSVLVTLLKSATLVAANAGNLRVLRNLFTRYRDVLTRDYSLFIITTLLSKYELTNDDKVVGGKLSSLNLTSTIQLILYNWNLVRRGTNLVYNNAPLLTASSDSLKLLLLDSENQIGSIIQLDCKYNLPQQLLH